ncbi:unnamed protein product [Phytophthora lilii]|uniref:Unnamed protein product n=1 Tax=Phytophthora lilii TaxID=2077276 RepID=A0A9W6XC14_9STRA|nr:unnamed protein product [Phytophthora lilii]
MAHNAHPFSLVSRPTTKLFGKTIVPLDKLDHGGTPHSYYHQEQEHPASIVYRINAVVVVLGRCVIAPLAVMAALIITRYFTTAKFFIGPQDSYFAYSQLDPVMHGGCSGCICSCRKVLMQLSAFGSSAVMSKPAYEDLQAIATEAVAAGDYSRLTPEALALADELDANGAVCSTGVNDWGTPNVVLADGPEGELG